MFREQTGRPSMTVSAPVVRLSDEADMIKGHDSEKVAYYTSNDKVFAACFYGICSIAVIFTNKAILTNYQFPYFNFLATVQFCVTIFVISVLVMLGRIQVPYLTIDICKQIIPISLMFLANIICGLGSTKSLNLPMFTALRRFSILFTMIAEWCYLNCRPSTPILWSVVFMVGGASLIIFRYSVRNTHVLTLFLSHTTSFMSFTRPKFTFSLIFLSQIIPHPGACIAALYDLSFDVMGYTFIFLNNLFTGNAYTPL